MCSMGLANTPIRIDDGLVQVVRLAYLCGLETAGKLSPDEAHSRIRDLYEQLARTKKGLGIGEPEA